MSRELFITSAKPLTALPNPWVRVLSIDDALALEMELPDFLLENPDIDRTEPLIQVCDSEEHLEELEIMPLVEPESWVRTWTAAPALARITGRYTGERAKRLLDYLHQELTTGAELQLWQIGPDDEIPPRVRRVPLAQLTVEDLRFPDNSDGLEGPQRLIIRWE